MATENTKLLSSKFIRRLSACYTRTTSIDEVCVHAVPIMHCLSSVYLCISDEVPTIVIDLALWRLLGTILLPNCSANLAMKFIDLGLYIASKSRAKASC